MNGIERILAAAGLQAVDATPVAPVLLMQGATALNLPLREYFGQPTRLAEGQQRLLDTYGHDACYAFPHIVQDVLPWGAGFDLHDSGPPSVNRMAFRTEADWRAAPVPVAADHPYLRRTLEAATALRSSVGDRKLVVGAAIGPFSLPSMLMGTRKFLELLLRNDDAALAALLERMTEYVTRWVRAQFEAGCHLVVIAEGIASASVLDRQTFRHRAVPVIRELFSRFSTPLALEFVGHAEPFLADVRDIGAAAYLVGESDDLGACRRALGPQAALMGTLNNIKMLRWSADRVEFEARRLIQQAGRGFILANQGPEIPFDTDPANIHALVRAARHGLRQAAA